MSVGERGPCSQNSHCLRPPKIVLVQLNTFYNMLRLNTKKNFLVEIFSILLLPGRLYGFFLSLLVYQEGVLYPQMDVNLVLQRIKLLHSF